MAHRRDLNKVRSGGSSANSTLIPLLKETYPGLVDSRQRFSIGDEAVRSALSALDEVNLSAAPAHALGEAFQALMGPRLRGDKGQFFTPRSVVKAMVEIVAPNLNESVLDPACGTGGFLLEAHSYRQRNSAGREVTRCPNRHRQGSRFVQVVVCFAATLPADVQRRCSTMTP